MIKQIEAAGLSGMTGKPTKHGNTSLFAKLLAMLEKHAELSSKGKGLQRHGAISKGKGVNGLVEPGLAKPSLSKLGLAQQTDPLIAAKSKHLLALATKSQAENKDHSDEDATVMLNAHIIIDPATQLKKAANTEKTALLIAGLSGEKSGGLTSDNPQNEVKTALNKGADKTDQINTLLSKMTQSASEKAGSGKSADASVADKQAQTMASASTPTHKPIDASMSAMQKNQLAEQAAQALQSGGLKQTDDTDITHKADKAAVRSVTEGQKTPDNQNPSGKADQKSPAEVMSIAASAHLQKTKAVQAQQMQQPATASLASAGQISISDTSLADSGSQFADNKGGQDARLLTTAMADARSTTSSASTQTNFQTYLTSKTTPAMSLFDSMNHIAQSAKNGQTRLEIQLDPANLGKIHISLQSDAAKQLQIHIIVDQSMTRAALEQQLPQLRSALTQQGFDLSGFSMDSQGQQASNGSDGKHQHSHHGSEPMETGMGNAPIIHAQHAVPGSGLSIRV